MVVGCVPGCQSIVSQRGDEKREERDEGLHGGGLVDYKATD